MPGGKGNIKPEDGKQFSSVNQPKNRRKSTKWLTDFLTKELKLKKEVTIEGFDVATGQKTTVRIPIPNKEIIVQALLRQAAKGNVNAIKEVFDRVEGKVLQSVDLTTAGKELPAPPAIHIQPVALVGAPPIAESDEEDA